MEGSKIKYADEPRHSSPAGRTIRQKEPTNLEMPFDQLDSYLTPTELFYRCCQLNFIAIREARRRNARSHCRYRIPPFARRFGSKDPQR